MTNVERMTNRSASFSALTLTPLVSFRACHNVAERRRVFWAQKFFEKRREDASHSKGTHEISRKPIQLANAQRRLRNWSPACIARRNTRGGLDFDCRLDPGAWGVASPPRPNVNFVVNAALLIKTLEVQQQGRPRELHRSWCWPRRSSHGQNHFGSRPCTLAPRPAPKSTATLFDIDRFFLLFFLRKSRGEVPKKKLGGLSFKP